MSAPALRFTDADRNNYPAWTSTRLQDVAAIVGGGTPDSGNPSYWGGGIPWFTPTEIKSKHLSQTQRTLTPEGVSSSSAKMLPAGALLLSTRATVGEVGIATVPCCTNQGFQSLVVNTDQDREFWYYWLGHNKDELLKRSAGSTFLEISKKSLGSIPANAPSLPEQRRIADALSAVDAKIDLLGRKRDALARFKAGLMQKLFSQEVRFTREDGSAYPDWEEKRLGEAFVERSERGYQDAMLLAVTQSAGIVKAETLERGISASADRSKYKRVIPGDIAYNSMRMWQGASGLSLWEGIVSPAYTVVTPNSDQDGLFWSYLFKHPPVVKDFERFSQGLTSDTWNLKFPAFSKVEVVVPSIGEQERIASALSAIDDRLNKAASQIATMQAFKKGLLQQMFV